MGATIFIVLCEYTKNGVTQTFDSGFSFEYEKAKAELHRLIDYEKSEGEIPSDYDGWTDHNYEDEFVYKTEDSKLLYYVCGIEEIE